jgi:hypothetical protein
MNYSEEDCARIEKARNRGESSCIIRVDTAEFILDFQAMTQRRSRFYVGSLGDATSGDGAAFVHQIRTWQPEWSDDRALGWNKRILELFPSWDSQTEPVQVCCVDERSGDFEKVANKLFEIDGGLAKAQYKICQVKRVQHLERFMYYASQRDAMIAKRGAGW